MNNGLTFSKLNQKTMTRIITLLLLVINAFLFAQGPVKPVLFSGATVHTGAGNVIPNAFFAVKDNTIVLVGASAVNTADYDTVINLTGKHIYPGYFALNSTLGLREVDAIRATLDYDEVGELNPHVRSLAAFNTDSRLTETIRSNGIFTVQATPQAGFVTGSSSVFRLNGWNWEDAVRKEDEGIHINWPESNLPRSAQDTSKSNDRTKEIQRKLKTLFQDAAAYSKINNQLEKNLKLDAMRGLFNGSKTLYLHAYRARDISDAVQFAVSYGIKRICIVGGSDSDQVIDLLKRYKVSVILSRLHQLPDRPDDPIEKAFGMPKLLNDAGIVVAISNFGGMEQGTRNLGFTAGTAVAYGMTKEAALQLITLNPARILGMEKTDGSLEQGKRATFFVTSGDALDMRTAAVELAFIDGIPVDLDNHQKVLYRKFMRKYGLMTN